MAPFALGVETVCQVCEPAAQYSWHTAECTHSYGMSWFLHVEACAVQCRISQVWITVWPWAPCYPSRSVVSLVLWQGWSIALTVQRKGRGQEVPRPALQAVVTEHWTGSCVSSPFVLCPHYDVHADIITLLCTLKAARALGVQCLCCAEGQPSGTWMVGWSPEAARERQGFLRASWPLWGRGVCPGLLFPGSWHDSTYLGLPDLWFVEKHVPRVPLPCQIQCLLRQRRQPCRKLTVEQGS